MPKDIRSISAFGTEISFEVDRSSRRRNITIEIADGGKVIAKTPKRVEDGEIEKVVRDNARWILTKLADAKKNRSAKAKRKFEDGETLLFKGDEYKLKLVDATGAFPVGEVLLEDGTLAVSVFLELAASDPLSAVRDPLVQWYKQQAAIHFRSRASHFAGLFGVEVRQVIIRDQKRRWGSCNAQGELRFCYRLIMADPNVIDYVIAHEVCHLLEMNHSAAYWDTLANVMPDYKARRHELRRIGGMLVL